MVKIEPMAKTGYETRVMASLADEEVMRRMPGDLYAELVRALANKIADAYIDRVTPEVLKAITPEAIATMTMANMGASIAKEVNQLAKVVSDKPVAGTTVNNSHASLFGLFG